MTGITRGAIVSFQAVENFDQMELDVAEGVLYNDLIPACEKKGVFLSSYGNHAGRGNLFNVEKYNQEKEEHKLFDVKRIQKAFTQMNEMAQPCSQYNTGSYGFKHSVERHQKSYIANGDLIAAMLLRGYSARFGKRNEDMEVNCEFKVKRLISAHS